MITRVKHGTVLDVLCYRTGEEIDNGARGEGDQPIPGVTVSNVWLYVRVEDGKEGYIPEVWTVAQVGAVDTECRFN